MDIAGRKYSFKRTDQKYRYMVVGVIICLGIFINLLVVEIINDIELEKNMFSFEENKLFLVYIIFILLLTYIVWWFFKNDFRLAKYKKKGECFQGKIIAAYKNDNPRYKKIHLVVEFSEHGKIKKIVSQSYSDYPDYNLRDLKCLVYKYKNRYFEGDFNIKKNGNHEYQNLNIKYIKRTKLR